MLKFLAVFLALSLAVDAGRYVNEHPIRTFSMDRVYDPRISTRIVNGEPADIADFPHMLVYLDFTRGGFRCGASVISSFWSLTAAHCSDIGTPPHQLNLRGGSTNRLTGGYLFFVEDYFNHPSYDRRTLEYDIALIKVQEDTPMGGQQHVQAIALPPVCGNNVCCHVCNEHFVTTTGWGRDEHGNFPIDLRQLTKQIHDRDDCNRIWGSIGPSLFCKRAEDGRDTCNGDSGSPLVTGQGANRIQVGVVSFGSSVCGDGSGPSVNVRIEHSGVRSWITDIAGV